MQIPVIAILDIGKTNKKAFLFDEQYRIVYDQSTQFEETVDEDGFPCEDVTRLEGWIREIFRVLSGLDTYNIVAWNVSAYGASFVHLDASGRTLKPLYNYLKPFPEGLRKKFYDDYGGEERISLETASPSLGNLNSGLQLYRLSKERQNYFTQVNKSLHLPQFATWVIAGQAWSDMTSIGCHTLLWDFSTGKYHRWVAVEGVADKLAPLFSSDQVMAVKGGGFDALCGVGLHDSSAALIPYLAQFSEPFLLLSTGTWNISLNPFNTSPLTADELRHDCLCYLDYKGNPVKASRLFAGNAHEHQARRLAEHFHVSSEFYKEIAFNPEAMKSLQKTGDGGEPGNGTGVYQSVFSERDLRSFKTCEAAYYQLVGDIMNDQVISLKRVMEKGDRTSRIFVDGGFSQNDVFMNLLCSAFPTKKVYAANVHQASALGAALAIHTHWNRNAIPMNLIDLKSFST